MNTVHISMLRNFSASGLKLKFVHIEVKICPHKNLNFHTNKFKIDQKKKHSNNKQNKYINSNLSAWKKKYVFVHTKKENYST